MHAIHPGILIGVNVVSDVLKGLPASTATEDVCKTAMREALRDQACFMCSSDDDKFKIGVGALLVHFKNDATMKTRVESELRILGAFNAAMTGVPVNFDSFLTDDAPEPLGLLGMFKDALRAE